MRIKPDKSNSPNSVSNNWTFPDAVQDTDAACTYFYCKLYSIFIDSSQNLQRPTKGLANSAY